MTAEQPPACGILVVDKPASMTSHDVVQRVRRALRERRVGHTGTLDPAATGVLVLCVGRATRLAQFLQAGSKTYAARMVLGIETDSQDADGVEVARTPAGHVTEREVCEALTAFQGTIEQVPPMVSAVKVGGERLYAKARRGEVVERAPRRVTVHDLVLDEFVVDAHPIVSFLVSCSAGTYVRTLAYDVGRRLGVGASLVGLRRLANGPFTVDEAHPLASVDDRGAALLVPVDDAVARAMPVVEVGHPTARRLVHGGRMPAAGREDDYAVCTSGRLVGVYRDQDGAAVARRVWMRPEELA